MAVYTPITPVELTITDDSTYQDVDVSAYVTDASGVRLHVSHTFDGPKIVAFRNNGSTADILDRIEGGQHITIDVGIDDLDIFEARLETTGSDYDVHLLGYWDDTNVVFLDQEVDAGTAAGSWTGRSIAAESGADTAIAALITFHEASSSDRAMGIRKTGSTDSRIQEANRFGLVGSTAIGLNGSESFDYYQSSNFANIYITGYIKSGVTMNTNATDITPGTTGSWQALSVGSVDGAFIEVVGATTEFLSFGVRPKNDANYADFYGEMSKYHALASVSSDGGVDGKIESSSVSLFLLGTIDGTATGTTLVVQDSSHSQVVDGLALTQSSQLAVTDSAQSTNVDTLTLVQANTLTVDASGQVVSVNNLVLAQAASLAVNDALHGAVVDGVALTQANALSVLSALHSVAIDNVVLSQSASLAVNDTLHGATVSGVVLTQANTLSVLDTLHSAEADDVSLTQSGQLAVEDTLQSNTSDNIVLQTAGVLSVADALQQCSSGSVVLTQANILVVSDSDSSQSADNITLSSGVQLSVQEATQASSVDALVLSAADVLAVLDAAQAVSVDPVGLVQSGILVVSDSLHAQLVDAISLVLPGSAVVPGARVCVVESAGRQIVVLNSGRTLVVH